MNRPWVIWMILVVCGLLIVGAMGWLTHRTLGMEEERIVAQAEAKVEERVRLALSRMDTAASAMLVIENQRPPEHFQSFFEPKDLFTNTLQSVNEGLVMQPSPLLADPPEFVQLHFELWANKALTSPQVPTGNRRDLAEASGIAQQELEEAASRLDALRVLLAAPGDPNIANAESNDNMSMMIAACLPNALTWNTLPMEEVQERSAWMSDQLQQSVASNYINPAGQATYQEDLSLVDRGRRMQVYEEAQSKATKVATKKPGPSRSKMLEQAQQEDARRREMAEGSPVAEQVAINGAVPAGASVPAAQGGRQAEMPDPAPAVLSGIVDLEVTPFRPVWLDGELFAVRRVRSMAGVRYQGFWIEAEALKASLLDGVSDLLPDARLTPVNALVGATIAGSFAAIVAKPETDPRALVILPWRLEDGVRLDVALAEMTPLQVSLGIGWVAVLLAMIAAAVLVRSVLKMAERRAAFVSSVTHELRTPLTTFQLYSDMLAEGMVKDAEKRQGYLDTMRLEAGRLNHLIENVLAYSRIERGSARARREKLSLASLIDRFHGRLADRVECEDARIEVIGVEECGDVTLDTDVTAVEQIVFNLVDNACKYGLPDDGERLVSLRASNGGGTAKIEVCDSGCGIVRADRKKLFRPFHKSAHDAANSKPGVGLGLALCRRLARALGGDLTVDCDRDRGACFVLELPVGR
jgi:signal transduction histidine kinase